MCDGELAKMVYGDTYGLLDLFKGLHKRPIMVLFSGFKVVPAENGGLSKFTNCKSLTSYNFDQGLHKYMTVVPLFYFTEIIKTRSHSVKNNTKQLISPNFEVGKTKFWKLFVIYSLIIEMSI